MANLTQKKQDKGSKNQSTFSSDVLLMPFNQLVQDPDNVRKTRSELGIKELADNIKAEGLLQNLIIKKVANRQYAVTGGERRRQALALLVKDGHIKPTGKIPCQLIEGDGVSASLSENIHRVAMNPADQSVAFVQLKESGLSIKEISLRHGLSVRQVEQRMALGRLSPVLLEALRSEKISLGEASAYTLVDDHKKQESVFEALGRNQSSYWIKKHLTEDELEGSNKLAKFVGREVYEAKGGVIRTDLFEDTVYFTQPELVMTLATERLKKEAERLKAEGWKWVECSLDSVYAMTSSHERLYPAGVLTAEQEKELSKVNARIAEIEALEGEWEEGIVKEHESLSERLYELEEGNEAFSDEQKANAGGFLSVCYEGTLDWLPGYVRDEDKLDSNDSGESNDGSDVSDDKTGYTKALRSDLAALRLEIMQTAFLENPAIASDLFQFHLLRGLLRHPHSSCFEVKAMRPSGKDTELSQGDMGCYSGREKQTLQIKALSLAWLDEEDILSSFKAFRELSQDEKTALQAYVAVLTLRPQLNDGPYGDPVVEEALCLMDVDFAGYWTPNEMFFNRLNKHQLTEIARSEISEEFATQHENSKKAVFAEGLFRALNADDSDASTGKGSIWIPNCLSIVEKQ